MVLISHCLRRFFEVSLAIKIADGADLFVQRRKTKNGRFLRSSAAALEHFANKRSPKAKQTEARIVLHRR